MNKTAWNKVTNLEFILRGGGGVGEKVLNKIVRNKNNEYQVILI